ncbi:hypothetical protein KJC18_12165 [Mammaliicoccus sciuri]|uniref:hypothetical protein n=1 Tax=Mammaliicoccus sciuri TaxID=1296 RepID=UPI00194E0FFF|nr:hypothetical protein [Mammaliicoccus sciuri]HDH6132591.1 hypothetical protein [Staphylococcus aureus]MCE4981523.1 hypothetical protein [Mammaliicoccus sciuri]MCE5086434.1 hypothetical protein [Mammaliicoccus sciuri]MCE5095882.1 hypothetical protein [Mammaliicoccus sciuri]HDK4630507.1 hypothetical protein [Staphylococcus aureus]
MIIANNKDLENGILLDFTYYMKNKMTFEILCQLIEKEDSHDFLSYSHLMKSIGKYDEMKLKETVDKAFSSLNDEERHLLKEYGKLYLCEHGEYWYSKREVAYILTGYDYINYNGLGEILPKDISEERVKNLSIDLLPECKAKKKTGKRGSAEIYISLNGVDEMFYLVKEYNLKGDMLNNILKRHLVVSDSDKKINEYIDSHIFEKPHQIKEYITKNRDAMLNSLEVLLYINSALDLLKCKYKEAKEDVKEIYDSNTLSNDEKIEKINNMKLRCVESTYETYKTYGIKKEFLMNVHHSIEKYKYGQAQERLDAYSQIIDEEKNKLLSTFDHTKQSVMNSLRKIENFDDEYQGVEIIDSIAEWIYRNKTSIAKRIIEKDCAKLSDYIYRRVFTEYDYSFRGPLLRLKREF